MNNKSDRLLPIGEPNLDDPIFGEAAIEAARLAKAAGKPVKLVWTREEEFTWAYFRPAGVIDVRSAVDKNGRLTAWEFHNYNSGTSAIGTMYDVPNKKIEFHPVDAVAVGIVPGTGGDGEPFRPRMPHG